MKYYSVKNIVKKNSTYSIIFGERSNGKTYALLEKGLKDYIKHGHQLAYIRRWKEDITGRRAGTIFSGINQNGVVSELTDGQYDAVHYFSGRFYLCFYKDNKPIYSEKDIIGYVYSLTDNEHNKSTSTPRVQNVIFDEFLTNRTYLNDEFVLFMNTLSTIVRRRDNVKIWMLGNTVSKHCPYFKEMGLKNVLTMEQGTIDTYTFGQSDLTVSVEYCKSGDNKSTKNNKYFAFDNPKLKMITTGAWELDIYPHCPVKYSSNEIVYTYFIEFSDIIYQCEIVSTGSNFFTYIHVKTTPIKNDNDLVYKLEHSVSPYHSRSIYTPKNKLQTNILWFFKHDKVFYQNNEVGDGVRNYLKTCAQL